MPFKRSQGVRSEVDLHATHIAFADLFRQLDKQSCLVKMYSLQLALLIVILKAGEMLFDL